MPGSCAPPGWWRWWRWRPSRRVVLVGTASVVVVGYAWVMWAPFPRHWVADYPAACRLVDVEGNPLRVVIGPAGRLCHPVALESTGQWCAKALVAAEDKRFFRHPGVDPLAIIRAMGSNVYAMRVVSGASTLTTQVIRMVTDRPRTLPTKSMEALRALQLDARQSKGQILEQYLNRAPMGGNLHGVEAAARRYFGKPAGDLTLGEAALLMGLPQSPSRFRPDRYLPRARLRQRYVLDRMLDLRFISTAEHAVALAAPLAIVSDTNPFLAPHACDLIVARHGEQIAAHSGRGGVNGVLRTTLDPRVQNLLEQTAARHRSRLAAAGARDIALVVLDVASGSLLGLVGSHAYHEPRVGQVNGATQPRSPGSALKPFIYADAIEQGRLIPASVVYDTPVRIGSYEPANYGRHFSGPVSVRDALVQSLNMPAIREVQHMGPPRLAALLADLGVPLAQDHGAYGLSMALGSGEVTLLDLANAYAVLARGGQWLPVRMLAGAERPEGMRTLFSAETCYLIADMLGGAERPMPELGGRADVHLPRVAWKTGTSTAHRDAWTLAFNPEYVVGVWVGNVDGRPGIGLNGTRDAAPVALGLFRDLYPGDASPWFEMPDGIEIRSVCALSGSTPGRSCTLTIPAPAIRGLSSPELCPLH